MLTSFPLVGKQIDPMEITATVLTAVPHGSFPTTLEMWTSLPVQPVGQRGASPAANDTNDIFGIKTLSRQCQPLCLMNPRLLVYETEELAKLCIRPSYHVRQSCSTDVVGRYSF